MHFFTLFCKNFLYKSPLSCVDKNNQCLYLCFSFHLNKLKIKIEKKIRKKYRKNFIIRKNLYFIIKNNFLFKTKNQKLRSIASFICLVKNDEAELVCIRTKCNCIYILSLCKEKIVSLKICKISVIYGTNRFGQGNVLKLRNDLVFTKGFNAIIFGILEYFPCVFLKKFQILKGIKFLNHVNINSAPLLIMLANKFKGVFFLKLNQLKNQICGFFLQIGNFLIGNSSILSDTLILKTKIFIAVSDCSLIVIWKITFDTSKNLKKIQTCAYLSYFGNTMALFLEWGGIFYNYLFTGEIDYKITIWNEFLFPILKINTKKITPVALCLSLNHFGFFLILKKHPNRRKKSRNNRFFMLPQNTIKLYTNRNTPHLNFSFMFDKLYYLKITKNIQFSSVLKNILKFDKKLNKNNFLKLFLFSFFLNILNKVQTGEASVESVLFFYKLIKYNSWGCFFLNNHFVFYMMKKELLYQIQKINQLRKFSVNEIETEKEICIKKNFFYKSCKMCKRLSKFKWMHKNIKKTCQFFHCTLHVFYFFPMQPELKFFENFKLQLIDKKKLSLNQIFKIFFSIFIELFNQKEFIWLWKKCNMN